MSNKTNQPIKRWRYIVMITLLGIFLLGASIASIVCWAVIYKPFDEFERVEMQAVYGENIKQINHYDYVWYYEVDGKVYAMHKRRGSGYSWPTKIVFHYLKANPQYTLVNRTGMLIFLPILSVIVILIYAVLLRLYKKDIQKADSNKIRTFSNI